MSFSLGFFDAELLREAAPSCATGRYPRLRFVSLSPRQEVQSVVDGLPEHVRRRVELDPSPELLASGEVQGLLCGDPDATAATFPGVARRDILTWDDLGEAYDRWLRTVALPAEHDRHFTPDGLLPLDWPLQSLTIEVIGSCGAQFVVWAITELGRELGTELSGTLTVRNHPGPGDAPTAETAPDVRLVVPPLRYMHPATLDDVVRHPDPESLLHETVAHLRDYLDSVQAETSGVDLYVCGFVEPHANPDGVFFAQRRLGNFRHFVRTLNDELVAWCERSGATHFVDGDAIAGAIGKLGVDDGAISFFGHRSALDIYDDNVDAVCGCDNVSVRNGFDVRTPAFTRAIVREVVHRHVIRGQRDRVKAVIVDLDNTLWRGLAADGEIGSFNGRPQGLVEALLILRRRGIFVAVASRNDESYIREHWQDILYRWPDVPLSVPLALDDFDALRIDFRSKAVTVSEILSELNVLPEHAVFVDDNPLEREEVQAALPRIRVLGAELNQVRCELLYSPFTQRDVRTPEDGLRAATAARQVALQRAVRAGDGESFLSSLGLCCELRPVSDPGCAEAVRAIQLVNKTNQWSLNGARIDEAELGRRLDAGERLFTADVRDAHHAYGIVAAALLSPQDGRVSHLVVSCRVIGMGIDDAIMSVLLARHGPLTLDYSDSGRNRAATAALRRWTGALPDAATAVATVPRPEHIRPLVAQSAA